MIRCNHRRTKDSQWIFDFVSEVDMRIVISYGPQIYPVFLTEISHVLLAQLPRVEFISRNIPSAVPDLTNTLPVAWHVKFLRQGWVSDPIAKAAVISPKPSTDGLHTNTVPFLKVRR